MPAVPVPAEVVIAPSPPGASTRPIAIAAKAPLVAQRADSPIGNPAAARETSALPRLPDASAQSGLIWPPVDGRVYLHEASAARATLSRLPGGSLLALAGGWMRHSPSNARFDDLETGRAGLLRWARLHAGAQAHLSKRRCVVLAETGHGDYRLWQVIGAERSLRRQLEERLRGLQPAQIAVELGEAAKLIIGAYALPALEPLGVAPTIDSISRLGEARSGLAGPFEEPGKSMGAVFTDLLPFEPLPHRTPDLTRLVRHLVEVVGWSKSDQRESLAQAIDAARSSAFEFAEGPAVVSRLLDLLRSPEGNPNA